jgi:hypothetical protein
MSQNRKLSSLVSVVALFGATGLLAAACSTKDDGTGGTGSCTEIGARVSALQDSSVALTGVAAGIKTDVISACAQIAGMTAPATPTDDDVRTVCAAAKAKIQATLNANVQVVVVPPQCTVDAQAQFDCEADCQAKADLECTPPMLDVRCDPGQLSVECAGTCNANAYCEGNADVAVDCKAKCEGSCTGTCTGTCSGTCSGDCTVKNADGSCNGSCTGTCTGECSANCMGSCKGSCKVEATGGVMCGANARCKGGCTGTASAPKCEGTLKPAECTGSADVDCSADCNGSASLKAQCTPAKVDIVGMIDADVKADLVAALPKLIKVNTQGKIAVDAVGDLSDRFAAVAKAVPACTLEIGGAASAFLGAASATAQASVSVSVSFQASADVSASAGAG